MSPAEPQDDVHDPRAFRWVESGVSGLARAREWDATALVELPELEADPLATFELTARAGDLAADAVVPREALERVAAEVDEILTRPFRARAVRQGCLGWLVGAVELGSEEIELPGARGALSIEVAVPPGGGLVVFVDGEEIIEPFDAGLAAAVAELERRGRARFESFVARADKVSTGCWDLTIDPL
jgi:hypothetical protein